VRLNVFFFAFAVSVSSFAQSATQLDHFLDAKDYPQFEQALRLAKLTPAEHLYFDGILADRLNHPAEAITDLEKVLPDLRQSSPHRTALALDALSFDYFLVGRYSEATSLQAELLQKYAKEFSSGDAQGLHDNQSTFALIGNAPPQSISGSHTFTVATHFDSIGDLDVPVEVAGRHESWIFDTGANISAISRSAAQRFGLKVSTGQAHTQSGATGKEVPLSVAVIPTLTFGEAVIHNLVVLVMDDSALDIDLGKNGHYAIQGVLGYPVQAALGSFTLTNGQMDVAPSAPITPRSVRLYNDELNPIVTADYDNHSLVFLFDTGNGNAELDARFAEEFASLFKSLPSETAVYGGAGGLRKIPVYHLPSIALRFGEAHAQFDKITVVSHKRNVEPLDHLYGNLGQDLLKQFRSCTIDFSTMHLTLGAPQS
jgi:predicted aspartyl protease